MPLAQRRPDDGESQEWATDTSNNGQPSGPFNLEVAFDGDDPRGSWTTHIYHQDRPDLRLSTGHKTAIVIAGVDHEREQELSALIHSHLKKTEQRARVERDKILESLLKDDHLRWVR